MKLQPLSPMIGFQCSPSVQPVFGRGPTIFSSNGHVPVVTSGSSNGFHSRPPITPPNILDYFPGLGGDGLRVSWAHAVNSRSKLNSALMGMFLFDINLCCLTSWSPRLPDIVCQGFAFFFFESTMTVPVVGVTKKSKRDTNWVKRKGIWKEKKHKFIHPLNPLLQDPSLVSFLFSLLFVSLSFISIQTLFHPQ